MDVRSAELRLDGRPVHVSEAGAGRGVVLVHGLGLHGGVFRAHCRELARAGFHAVAPDLPGFGRSGGPRTGLSVPQTADWLLALADAFALGRPAWLGHSLGAQAVLDLAARAPDRARALVLATPTGAPGAGRLPRQLWSFLRDIGREPIRLVPAVARAYVRAAPVAYLGTWIRAARDRPAAKSHRVRCPTLILAGRRDPLVPTSYVELLRRAIPDCEFARLPDGGHGIVLDRSRVVTRTIIAFLRRRAG